MAEQLSSKQELVESDVLAPGCNLERLRKLLTQHPAAEQIILVGDEPDFSALVGELTGGPATRAEMKKAAWQ